MKLLNAFEELVSEFRPYFIRQDTFDRARSLAYSTLVTYGKHTISRLICSKNEHDEDWSADYKFFSTRKWDANDLFSEILRKCDQQSQWYQDAILIALDDTLRKKTGKKIPKVSTLRDPMSLPFHVNLVPGIRFIQASAIINPENRIDTSRAIPIYFEEAAPAKKPKKNASEEVKEQYKKEQKEKRISVKGHQAVLKIRQYMDKLPNGKQRPLYTTVDGSYCNRNFLRDLPENVTPIVRARKDLKLFKPADNPTNSGKGRHRVYGERLPTPEEIRKDDAYAWATVSVYAVGKYHNVRYKTVAPVLWPTGTAVVPYRLIIIAPLRYRKSKNSKLLYRYPAYILTPDLTTPIQVLLQFYFLRWDIEVNHRDEKSLIGVGDAQVRSPESVGRNPQFTTAIYRLLLLASILAYGPERTDDYLPLPKWRKQETRRPSTLDILALFRKEIMEVQLQQNMESLIKQKRKNKKRHKKSYSGNKVKKSGFVLNKKEVQTPLKLPVNIIAAMLYAYS